MKMDLVSQSVNGHLTDNSSKMEDMCGHKLDDVAGELFPCKSMSVTVPALPLENQHMGQELLGSENGEYSLTERNVADVGMDDSNVEGKVVDGRFDNDSAVTSSVLYEKEDLGDSTYVGDIRELNVDQDEKKSDTSVQNNFSTSMHRFDSMSSGDSTFTSSEESETAALTGSCTYFPGDVNDTCTSSTSRKGIDSARSIDHSAQKGGFNDITLGSYEEVMQALSLPDSSYRLLYKRPWSQTSRTARKKVSGQSVNAIVVMSQAVKSKYRSINKGAVMKKSSNKESLDSFPTNVKGLTATGIFDEVLVRYVSPSGELPGVICGTSYLCGCQSCNFAEALNAHEFEHHAGCKTKHPNNHIRLENGKSMHQIVQELKATPRNMLIDAVLSVTGSPINRKAYDAWKETVTTEHI